MSTSMEFLSIRCGSRSITPKCHQQALFDATRPTDPGSHQVRATAQGYKPFTTTVNVGEGAEATVNLRLEADLSPQPTPRTTEPSPASGPSGPPVVGSAGFQPTFAPSPAGPAVRVLVLHLRSWVWAARAWLSDPSSVCSR